MFGKSLLAGALILAATVTFVCTAAHGGDFLLRYRFVEGDRFAYSYVAKATAPIVGKITIQQTYSFHVIASHAHGASLECLIRWKDMPGLAAGETSCTLGLNDMGQVSSLSGPALEDPKTVSMARNVSIFFPALPADEIGVGAAWRWPLRLHLPKGGTPLKVTVDFHLKGVEDGGTGNLAAIDGRCVQKVTKKLKMDLKGDTTFDLAKGRLERCDLVGKVKVRKALLWITVPLQLRMEALALR